MPSKKIANGLDEAVLFQESVSLEDLASEAAASMETEAAAPLGTEAADMPCTINALTSGLSGGTLGYAFGFGAVS